VISLRRVAAPTASVVVRSQDSARTIEAALAGIRRQTVGAEIVVVDSGSSDETLQIAGRFADRIVELPRGSYRPGRALNAGTAAGAGEVVCAVSAHCLLPRADWLERALAHYGDPRVAGVNGTLTTPDRRPLEHPIVQNADDARRYPYWGFSNHASSWRRSVWEQLPFDEERRVVEDREWSLRVLDAGWKLLYDPALWVEQRHRWRAGTVTYFRRERRETRGLAELIEIPRYRARDLLREWLTPPDRDHSRLFHLLNYRRAAGLLGKYTGLREARR
jgi:glycosyltransferase involved in cell wall biosynthesis